MSAPLQLQKWGMRAGNRLLTPLYRLSGGRLHRTMRGLPVLLLTLPGRSTGIPRTTPVVYLEHDGALLVVGSAGGSVVEPQWFRNLRAAGRIGVQIGRDEFQAQVAVLDDAERDRVWRDVVVARAPFFADYQAKAGERVIPVARLTRVEPPASERSTPA